jgi:hypothetical protein
VNHIQRIVDLVNSVTVNSVEFYPDGRRAPTEATMSIEPGERENQSADVCPTHHVAMVRQLEHIGDGKTRWSEPFCPACREIEAGKMKDARTGPDEAAAQPER